MINLDSIDLTNGDFYKLQSDLTQAYYNQFKVTDSQLDLIPKTAELGSVSEFLYPSLDKINQVLSKSTKRLDESYSALAKLNNQTSSKIESVTTLLNKFKINLASSIATDFGVEGLIVSDNFKTDALININQSTGLLDTSEGVLSLPITFYSTVDNLKLVVDRDLTKGNPGSYSEISNLDFSRGVSKQPLVSYYPISKDISGLADAQANTWFELERVFVPPTQKVTQIERAYIASEVGIVQNVKKITQDFDWKISVSWDGETSEEKELVEFIDPDFTKQSLNTELVMSLQLAVPTKLSFINIKPLFKQSNQILLRKLEVLTNNKWVTVQTDIDLSSTNGLNKLLVAGLTSDGYTTQVPLDTEVQEVKFHFIGGVYLTKFGIAHSFKDVYNERRTERNHGLWRTADTWQEWGRVPVSSFVPKFTSESQPNKLVGTLINVGSTITGANGAINSLAGNKSGLVGKGIPTAQGTAIFGSKTQQAIVGSSALNSLNTLASTISPYVVGLQALDQIVGGLFQVDKSVTLLDTKTGYDVFKAYKSSVTLREIILGNINYGDKAIFISKPLMFVKPVTRVALFPEEDIPSSWPEGNYTSYSVSNDGLNWIPISKNSTLSDGYVEFTEPTKQVFYRAEIVGFTEDTHTSVKIKNIVIQGLE